MRTISALFATVILAFALSAQAAPKILICAEDGGDGTLQDMQNKLKATMLFAAVDVYDASNGTPSVNQMKMYDGILVFENFQFFDATALGNNLADYVDAGGGVVNMLFALDGVDQINITGRWEQGGYDCIIPGDYDFFGVTTKAQPNDVNSPIVKGVTGVGADINALGGLNMAKGAVSVWDWDDGTTAVCKMTINGHPRVDLGFYPGLYTDVKNGDGALLIANSLVVVAGGFNPMKGLPNPANYANTAVGAVSNPITITYTNSSMVQQTVNAITVGGTHAGDFIITKAPQLPLLVGSMSTFTVDVVFQPVAGGARSATLKAGVVNQMSTGDVALTGIAIPAAIKVTPYPIAMGGTQINVPVMKDITIANQGMNKVNVQNITITIGQTMYSLSNGPGFPVALIGGGSFLMTVKFNPNMNGTFPGQLTVTSDDPNSPTINVPIGGCAGPGGIALDANSVAFGNVNVGAQLGQPVNVTNPGCADLKVSAITVGGTNPGDFVVTPKKAIGSIGATLSEPFDIAFKPTMVGQRSATVTVTSDAGNKVVSVFGNGTTSAATVMPMALDLGNVKVKATSAPKMVNVSNVGNGLLKVLSIAFGGKDGAAFKQMGGTPPPFNVAGGANTDMGVVCTPPMIGPLTGTLTITTDIGDKVVTLTCNGTAPTISISPNSLDFGSVAVMQTSAAQSITITNKGTDDLHVDGFNIGGADQGDFISKDLPMMLPLVLAPNAMFTFHVTFTPSVNKAEMAEVTLVTDDPGMMMVTIPMTGIGIQKQISVAPMTVDFGVLMLGSVSAPKPVTITNTGDASITINTVAVGGAGGANFTADMKGPITIDVGMKAVINVTYSPLSIGATSATLTLTPDMLVPVVINLKGSGSAPSLTISPGNIDFGPIEVGMSSQPTTVGIKNGGTGPLMIDTIKSSDPAFTVDSSMTMLMLGPGGTTTFSIAYTPAAVAMNTGKVSITLKGGSTAIATVSVAGSGVERTLGRPGCGCHLGERPGSRAPFGLALIAGLFATLLLRRRRR